MPESPIRRFRRLRMVLFAAGLPAWAASWAPAASEEPRLGAFEVQVDGIGACLAVGLDASGEVLLLDDRGALAGAASAGTSPPGRDLASRDGAIAIAGREGVHVRTITEGPWVRIGTEPATAVDLGSGTVHALLEDGSVVRWDVSGASAREDWRRSEAFPGARGIVGLDDGGAWIADTDRHRLVRLGPDGGTVRAIGDRGAFPGLFNTPVDLAIAGDRLLVADKLNHRVSVHGLDDGTFLDQWGMHAVVPREGEGAIHYPEGIAVDEDGDRVVVLEPFERRYQVFGPLADGEEPSGASLPGRRGVESHFGIDVAAAGGRLAMWEPESGAAVGFDLDHGIPVHVATFAGSGRAPVGFGRVVSVGVDGERHDVWFVDAGHRRIHRWMLRPDRPGELIFDPFMGRFARGWSYDRIAAGMPAVEGSAAFEPVDLVIDDGRLHFLESEAPAIVVTDRRLEVERVVPLPADVQPAQLERRADGGWLVVDTASRRLLGIDADGAVDRDLDLAALGLRTPFGVAEADGLAVVSDRATDRLVSISPAGEIVAVAGETGAWDGALWRPAGLVAIPWADDGTVVIAVDHGNHRAQGFDPATGEWRVSFSLGQGHDRPLLKREDFESSADPAEPGVGSDGE